jgi:hypothetical protein
MDLFDWKCNFLVLQSGLKGRTANKRKRKKPQYYTRRERVNEKENQSEKNREIGHN